ncbi:chemotaxis protein [Roseivirga sp. BDSF3-8]|uniref:chemotaxis protein n=1 Tax=Roseivirga sp. BDSF3-8 TaxID=3241598 RepID=UPI0035320AC1
MYEDRIVASDILFDISRIIQEKEIAYTCLEEDSQKSQNSKQNEKLRALIEKYSLTKLTEKETFAFNLLQEKLMSLEQMEDSDDASKESILEIIEKIDEHLHDLSKIQLQEGRRQVFISKEAKDTINLFTQAEIIFLIVMGIMIQIIILYKPKGW